MEAITDTKMYEAIEINGVIFEKVQIFIWKHKIELISYLGYVVAQIYKSDIKTIYI